MSNKGLIINQIKKIKNSQMTRLNKKIYKNKEENRFRKNLLIHLIERKRLKNQILKFDYFYIFI